MFIIYYASIFIYFYLLSTIHWSVLCYKSCRYHIKSYKLSCSIDYLPSIFHLLISITWYLSITIFIYHITPHISTCAYSKDNWNFAIFHREKARDIKHMRFCPTITKKRVLETCYSMISRPKKTKLCKHNLSSFNHLSKYLYFRLVTETKIVI